jgi:hypothetical protein
MLTFVVKFGDKFTIEYSFASQLDEANAESKMVRSEVFS